jgi:hypothetical protein
VKEQMVALPLNICGKTVPGEELLPVEKNELAATVMTRLPARKSTLRYLDR